MVSLLRRAPVTMGRVTTTTIVVPTTTTETVVTTAATLGDTKSTNDAQPIDHEATRRNIIIPAKAPVQDPIIGSVTRLAILVRRIVTPLHTADRINLLRGTLSPIPRPTRGSKPSKHRMFDRLWFCRPQFSL